MMSMTATSHDDDNDDDDDDDNENKNEFQCIAFGRCLMFCGTPPTHNTRAIISVVFFFRMKGEKKKKKITHRKIKTIRSPG